MRKTTRRALAAAVAGALVLTACGEAPEETPEATDQPDATEGDDEPAADGDTDTDTDTDTADETADAGDFRACMITDQGGVDDGSFNETAYNGLLRAEEELGVQVDYLESQSETDFQPNMQAFIQQDCSIIIPVGFLLEEVTMEAAEGNPDQRFAIVDVGNPDGVENVLGLTFNTSEAAFLAGYAAAAQTESGIVGTYGGLNIPTVTIFMDGFLAGVDHFNEENGEDVQVLGWDGSDGQFTNDFTSLDLGRSVTETLMDNGADIIMPVAGPVGGGSAAAIQDRGEGLLIWVDTDGYESTDFGDIMFTSVMKQMDVAVFDAIEAALNDEFEGGEYVGTLENDGVALAPFHDYEDQVPDGLHDELDQLRQQIIDGELETTP
ncbi:BMP family lipoprotein [Egicoccus halophilus]|uniref:BMP family ABC transporter substrate-binding protein n=1 Tax=Egicoccus halophilus TaxID=1670830 RepID=A0A8J3A938_9ACTN|nr:BMP family ABC transporter substrate-binding protein [Egicoccus halophilus]GGI04757.1 BMP family ABC transporter substrate-binding protein [Egicoccus halophilus]